MTKIYVMLECDVDAEEQSPSDSAVDTIVAMLAHECDSETDTTYAIKLWSNKPSVTIHKPTVLPDDIEHILWRDSVKDLTMHDQLEAAIKRNG